MDKRELQERIDAALINPETGRPWQRYSPYLSTVANDLQIELESAGRDGGLEGILDRFDGLLSVADPFLLRVALATVLYHHPLRETLGLRVP
jgi:hypothetical protein